MRRLPFFLAASLALVAFARSSCAFAAPLTLLDDPAEPSCDINLSVARSASGSARLLFDRQNERNAYALTLSPRGAKFTLVRDGKETPLGEAPVAWAQSNRVTLQRRPFEMELLVNGTVALRAFDPTWTKGSVGTQVEGGWKVEGARVQPVEDVRFDDDFTREGTGGDSDWTTPSGTWTLSAASSHVSSRTSDMSANPFAYGVAQSSKWALATAGRKFWSDYDARVSVRPQRGGTVGIAAYVQDPKNYLAFVLTPREDGSEGVRRLVLVRDGKERTLAQTEGGFVAREWVQIGLRLSPGYVEALLDGAPVLRAGSDAFGQGAVGLLSRGAPSLWDDVSVRTYPFWRADFSSFGAWNGEGWNKAGPRATAQTDGARLLTGRDDWSNYRALVSTPWSVASSGGVLAGVRDAANYALIRWAGSGASVGWKGKIQAVQVVNGQEKVKSSAPFGSPQAMERLTFDVQNGAFSLVKDGRAQVSLLLPGDGKGRFGFLAPRAKATFADPVIFFPPPPDPPKIASKFVSDGFMLGWASPVGEWPPTPDKDGLQFWNSAELFGPWTLDFPWRASWRGQLEMALFADRANFDSGLILRGEATGEGEGVDWTLRRGDKTLAKAHSKLKELSPDEDSGAAFHLAWNNGLLSLSSAKGTVFALPLDAPAGNGLGIRAEGFRVRPVALVLWSANRDDYTFADAPIDFYSPSGKWSVFARWPCYGDWSFFGGGGRQPSLWTKRTYGGDIVVDYYAHPQMELPKEPGYTHPGDLNVSLCGDGMNPASGYAFVVAGRDNTRTQIFRAGKLVADNDGDKAWFHDTINQNMGWHRTWVYVRARIRAATQDGKKGALVSLTVNDEKLCEYFDPSPLPTWNKGGRVCFWTLDSTLMLARAKIEAQVMGPLSTPASLRDTTPGNDSSGNENEPAPFGENDEQVAALRAASDGAWHVENRIAGGPFCAVLSPFPRSINPNSRLAFLWKASSNAKVDVYVRTGDDWHSITLSGAQKPDAMAPTLGAMQRGQEQNGWTPVSFDLGAALKGAPKVDEVRVGALHGDPYRWQGFNGNGVGAWYEVKGFALK